MYWASTMYLEQLQAFETPVDEADQTPALMSFIF